MVYSQLNSTLVVQITFLLFAVVARVVLSVVWVWVGARVAPSTSTMGTIFILDLARHLFTEGGEG